MEQIHAWLVGFGVSQFEQGWNPKSSGVPGIPPLRSHTRGQNNTHGQTHMHKHIHHTTTLNKQWYYKPHTDSVTSLITHTQTPWFLVYCARIKRWLPLCQRRKEGKTNKIKDDSQHSCSSPLSKPIEGWSAAQGSSAVLQEQQQRFSVEL